MGSEVPDTRRRGESQPQTRIDHHRSVLGTETLGSQSNKAMTEPTPERIRAAWEAYHGPCDDDGYIPAPPAG